MTESFGSRRYFIQHVSLARFLPRERSVTIGCGESQKQMSALKDQDPDYGPSVATNEKHQRIYEENARNSTARKITSIVEREFSREISTKEQEILEIQDRLHKTLKTLHLLRYVVVADFYGRKQCQIPIIESKQPQIHPAIKELIGKSPSTSTEESLQTSNDKEDKLPKRKIEDDPQPKKIPRYIPPKSQRTESPDPSRKSRHKVRKRIIVGNISKWIPPDWREDAASHKWTMYVRGDKENPEIDHFVNKVRFFLHPSYRPNDVVEVTSSPFCLSRRGWGEFPVRVQVHFKSPLDKPMDVIHHLKLDRTYTGLQTLGSETVVDVWIEGRRSVKEEVPETVKTEPKSENDKVLLIQRLRLSVEFDHNYTGKNCSQNNLTIKHSSPQVKPESNLKDANCSFVPSSEFREEFPEYKVNTCERVFLGPSSKVQEPTLLPLEISIPLPFENTMSKRVLVVQNDKTIPVDISSSKRSLSLLKNNQTLKLKPTSLLLNQTSNIPTLKIVNQVVLGKDKHKIQSKDFYERALNSIEKVRIFKIQPLLRFIIRRLPIVAVEAADPDYRRLHPYCCKSLEEFLDQNPAKQRSLEWNRALIARQFLIKKGLCQDELWTVKEIMVWAQFHGYTPNLPNSFREFSKSSFNLNTISEPIAFQKWLRNCPIRVDRVKPCEEEIIDVENEETNPKPESERLVKKDGEVLEAEKSLGPLYEFVTEKAREIGIKIGLEEIVPGILHCSVGRVLVSAVESLVDEILRGALANTCERNFGEEKVIGLEDVRRAILNREEFDFLTNEGLGSNYRPTLVD